MCLPESLPVRALRGALTRIDSRSESHFFISKDNEPAGHSGSRDNAEVEIRHHHPRT